MTVRLFTILLFLSPVPRLFAAWRTLDGVAYEENPYNDGDSFHAGRNRSRYIFRLYFVDVPETDKRYMKRVEEQAEYFGLTPEQALKGGMRASEFVEELLKDKILEVHTQYTGARGASDRKRYYAMVKVGGRWLSEILVERGLARVYGMGADLPDGTSERVYWSRLRKLEKEAREAHRGFWGTASGKRAAGDLDKGQTVKLNRQTPVFSVDPPHGLVGQLPEGWEVELGPAPRTGFRRISFTSPGGTDYTGEVQEISLK